MDNCKELLIKKERDTKQKLFRLWVAVPAVALGLIYTLTFNIIIFLLVVAFCIATYFVFLWTDIEFEYLYLDKEIIIDRIMSKKKRKRAGVIDLYKVEIVAPVKSPKLDEFKNREVKCIDYSAGKNLPEQKLYVIYYEGNRKFLLNFDDEFIKIISSAIPRKVFTA